MNTATTELNPPAATPSRRTVDAFTRTWHALLALSFAGAYLSADFERWRLVHVVLGYTAGGLWVLRLLWGLVGPRPARWSALWGKLRGLPAWLAAARVGQAPARQALNLALALSVALVLLAVLPVVATGYATYMELVGDWVEDIHEFFGNLMLAAVLAHVACVLLISWLQRPHLAWSMVSGRVPGRGPDLVRHNLAWLAALLLAAVLAFWGWQWQDASARRQAPDAPVSWLHPGAERTQSGGDAHEDDDD